MEWLMSSKAALRSNRMMMWRESLTEERRKSLVTLIGTTSVP